MPTYRVSEIFVPGGEPKHTYVARDSRGLEDALKEAADNFCKIATVTGATKSGKTVLVRKVFADARKVWLDGAHLKSMDDFWELVGDQLEAPAELESEAVTEQGSELGGDFEAEASALVIKGRGKLGGKLTDSRSATASKKLIVSKASQVIKALREQKPVLVIDDFHYLTRELQGEVTRSLKPLVYVGLPVIYLAIPHRRYDAVKVEREMNGRISVIEVPPWNLEELQRISELGFPLLNIVPNESITRHLAAHAIGSPHLMQEFCKQICYRSDIRETCPASRSINPNFDYSSIFIQVAADLGKNIFDKMARGPRFRTDRLERTLVNGKKTDIYKVVLIALSHLKPGVTTIEYEPLRAAMREILASELPQAHEVSRVLEQIARISSSDDSSVAVIDYEKDERKLHITDPFFAFFLRWGKDLIEA